MLYNDIAYISCCPDQKLPVAPPEWSGRNEQCRPIPYVATLASTKYTRKLRTVRKCENMKVLHICWRWIFIVNVY